MVVKISKARSTGTRVGLIDNRDQKYCMDGAPWEIVCMDHGGTLGSHSRRRASSWMSAPEEWCDVCQENFICEKA